MPDRFGASKDAWRYWSTTLGLREDLLPVVSRPGAPISGLSNMKSLGKTPSHYNLERQVAGIPKWTERLASEKDIERWSAEGDYGICVQTRRLRAIDIDVPDVDDAGVILDLLRKRFTFPRRWRMMTGKCLVPFWMDEPLCKHVIPVKGGMIEILGTGQQFIAEGTWIDAKTGEGNGHYKWAGSIEAAPHLDDLDFALLLGDLKTLATGEIRIAQQRKRLNGSSALIQHDDVADWLVDNWETYDAGPDGQIFIACPFADEHTADSGVSSTAYFPAGTGGYAAGNFVCLHAHCAGRAQAEFLNATGFVAGGFDVVPDVGGSTGRGNSRGAGDRNLGSAPLSSRLDHDRTSDLAEDQEDCGEAAAGVQDHGRDTRQALIEAERWPRLVRDKASRIEPTNNNMLLALASPAFLGRYLGYDRFTDTLMHASADVPKAEAQWIEFADTDYPRIRQVLELRGFKPMVRTELRACILAVARDNAFDSAAEWLGRQAWDGKPRVDNFAVRAWRWAPSPYSSAVSRYVWTALAGRVMMPGVQADMAPILVGDQGLLKTSAVKAMVPDISFYRSVKLDAHDDNTSRLLRGCLIAELEELRGLNSRSQDEIKAWVSKTHEAWVPKFLEFSTTYPRRNLFFGTTNEQEFLADPTGERRWLPGQVHGRCDLDWIVANRSQLWAEGAARFAIDGVDWEDAERLARLEHGAFKITDEWETYVASWLTEGVLDVSGTKPIDAEHLTISDILAGALHIAPERIDRSKEIRIGKVMKNLGWGRQRIPIGDKRKWVYVR